MKNKSNTRVAYPTILVLCYTDIKVVQEVDTYETVCQIDLEKLTFIVVVDDFESSSFNDLYLSNNFKRANIDLGAVSFSKYWKVFFHLNFPSHKF